MDPTEKIAALKDLQALREAGLISEEEFIRERKQIMTPPSKGWAVYKTLVQFFKAWAWPVVAIIVIFAFRSVIIGKLNEAEQVSIWQFSVKVREKAQTIGDPELAQALSGLSQNAIELLMDTGDKNMYVVTKEGQTRRPVKLDLDKAGYAELDARGLISGPEPYASFHAWATSLPGRKSKEYITESGVIEAEKPNEPHQENEVYIFDSAQLSEADVARLDRASFTLNEKGRKLWKLLGKVVSEQLTVAPPCK